MKKSWCARLRSAPSLWFPLSATRLISRSSDFVADLRAPTPSAAAELVIESKHQLLRQLQGCEDALRRAVGYRLLRLRHDLIEQTTHRGFRTVRTLIAQAAQRNDEATANLMEAANTSLRQARRRWERQNAFVLHFDIRGKHERDRLRLNRHIAALGHCAGIALMRGRGKLESLNGQLLSLSPRRILERGYAILFDSSGNVVKDASRLAVADEFTVRVAQGGIAGRVEKVLPEAST